MGRDRSDLALATAPPRARRVLEPGELQHGMVRSAVNLRRCKASLTIWRTRLGVTRSSRAMSS